MRKFNTKEALTFIESLCEQSHIKIHNRWSSNSSGKAWPRARLIKIPYPSNPYDFMVGLHEIKHVLDVSYKRQSYEDEYYADLFALNIGILFDYDLNRWIKSMRANVLRHIAKYTNKGGKVSNIPEEIQMFFGDIDLINWEGKKIVVNYTAGSDNDIKIYKYEPEEILFRRGRSRKTGD